MTASNETMPEGVPVLEELAAYLDGELDADGRRRVEEALSQNEDLRQRVKEYQQTWDLLEELPRPTVDASFTRTTVEMVAIRADAEVESELQSQVRRLWWIRGGMLVVVILAVAGGYWMGTRQLAAPNEQLIRDLPILEHLDAYQNAGSIEFLRTLQREELFEDGGDGM